SSLPSGEKATWLTRPSGSVEGFRSLPVAVSQRRILSPEAEATLLLSGEYATETGHERSADHRRISLPVSVCSRRNVPSTSPTVRVFPSGATARQRTMFRVVLVSARSVTSPIQRNSLPLASQKRTVVSNPPEKILFPSGEKPRPQMRSRCPSKVRISSQVDVSHTRTFRSVPPVARVLPSGEKTTP